MRFPRLRVRIWHLLLVIAVFAVGFYALSNVGYENAEITMQVFYKHGPDLGVRVIPVTTANVATFIWIGADVNCG